jgi:hypothetical protein
MPLVQDTVWTTAIAEFHDRKVDELRKHVRNYRVDTDRLEEVLDGRRSGEDVHISIATELTASVNAPGLSSLLAFYLLLVAREKWEKTTEWPQIERHLEAFCAGAEEAIPALRRRAPDMADIVCEVREYARTVITCTQVENALNCSCPTDVGEKSGVVVRRATETLERVTNWPAELCGPAQLLSAIARTDHAYYSQLTDVANSVFAVVDAQTAGWRLVKEAARRTQEAERSNADLRHDVYGTELRAHRRALVALEELQDEEWLCAELVRVVYCYPFHLSTDAQRLLRRVSSEGLDWDLNQLRPVGVEKLRLTDLWEQPTTPTLTESREEIRQGTYYGWALKLPKVVITTTDPHDDRRTLHAGSEVRFTSLGNHHLRLETTLEKAHAHYLNQALRRPMEVMGYEKVTSEGLGRLNQLVEYADHVIGAIRRLLGDPGGGPVPSVSKDAHAVLSVRRLSVGRPGEAREPAGGDAVLNPTVVGGKVLRHPVRQSATALEEWVRYCEEADGTAVLTDVTFQGDVVIRTANTTVLAMPDMPDFVVKAYEEAAEFVATLPVLLAHWRWQVQDTVANARRQLTSPRPDFDGLYVQRGLLQDRVAGIRANIAGLHSPALTRTVMGRQFLDRLVEAARIKELEDHLEDQLGYATATLDQYVTASDRVRQEQEGKVQRNLSLLGGIVGAAGIADVASLLNAALADGNPLLWIELGVVLLVVPLIVIVLVATGRRQR